MDTAILNFITKARVVHGNKYDYSKVKYKNNKTKVIITCPVHGDFEQTPSNHYKHGCWRCHFEGNAKNNTNHGSKGIKSSIKDVVCAFQRVHGDKYNYSKVKYKNNKTKVIITCLVHGDFEQTPVNHKAGKGCPKCYVDKLRFTNEDIIKKFVVIHGDQYKYDKVNYINVDTKVIITCPVHGDFEQTPSSHISGNGCPYCSARTSKPENEIYEYLNSRYDGRIFRNIRTIIPGYELDLYIPRLKLAIEYCGLYWHSQQRVGSYYHYEKMMACESIGIRLITIFEDEWLQKRNIVESKFGYEMRWAGVNKLQARKCSIIELDSSIKNNLLDIWHLQGRDLTACVSLGLKYEEEYVAVMTFGRPNASGGNHNYEWNLSRFASKPNTVVSGAFSRLLKYFIKRYNPKSIQTYADRRWSQGKVYSNNGFSLTHATKPNYWYYKNQKREHRFGYRKQELKRKLVGYDETKTEYENMLAHGRDRIWDCGNLAYELVFNRA